MDATQAISDSVLKSDESENEEEEEDDNRCRPVAKLCILRNEHIPETELHLFVGDNVLGRDPSSCTLPVPAPSISKKHVTISISVYSRRGRRSGVDLEALVWDLGSMNGTRKGRLKLTPNVRYALSDGDSLVLADIPCQFVSVNAVCLEKVTKTPVCKSFRIKESVPDSSGENVGDLNDCEELVNGDTKARTSTTKTAVQMNCLSVEQTPTQPEEILVPESDVDSDGGKDGDKVLVFDSDSHKSSPACSTFLSPANKTVPESEVESPITPSSSSSSKNRLYRRVNFSEEKAEVNVARQPLKGKKTFAIVDDSEEEEEEQEEERTTPEVMETKKNDQNVPVTSEPAVSVLGQNKLSVSMTSVCTDVEEEEEGEGEGARSSGPESSNTNQVTKKLKIDDFHLDSDTDVDEDENSETTTTTAAADETKPPAVDSGSPSKEVTVESDTDVEDHVDAADADADAPPADVKDLHMDSDTDVEEEDGDSAPNRSNSTLDETPSRLEVNPNQDDSAAAPHHGLHLESDTDDEEMPTPDLTEPPVVSAKELSTAASVGPDILSDSDTDVEDDSAEVGPPAATVSTAVVAGAAEPGTTVDGSNNRPVEESSKPPDLSVNSDGDTDVEEEEEEEETEEGQMPELCRENTCQMLVPLPQNCSTPVQLSERKVEELETQPFLCPSVPFSGAGAPDDSSSSSEKEEEENVAEASTQAFILQSQNCQSNSAEKQAVDAATESPGDENDPHSSRGGSFQLGLSDSSHLQAQAPDQDTEETQAFIPVGTSVFWDQTQEYAADPHLEATRANEEAEDSPRCSVTSEKESQQSLELETTQAYESKSSSDPQHETDEQQEKHRIETAETQLIETRPVSDSEETDQPEGAPPQQRSVGEVFLMAETQPMKTSDDEDFFQVPQKIKSKRLQPVTGSGFSIAETQPMAASENDDSDDDAASPGNHLSNDCEEEESDESQSFLLPRKRKAKQLHLQEEESQTLRNSETSAGETQSVQPVQTELGQEGESPPESRAKAATREAETQIICSSEVFPAAAQPHVDSETKDEDDLMIGQRKRKTKALQPEDEETQPLSVDVQPKVKGEDTESEESVSGQRKTKATVKQPEEEEEEEVQQPLAVAEAVEQPERQRRKQSEAATRQVSARNKRGTRSKEDKDQVECLPKRQTRGRNKSLSETRRERSPAEEEQSQGSEGLRGRKECSGINGKQEGDEETDKRESDEKDEEQRETCGQNIREEEQIEIQKQLQTENSDKEEQAERLELDTHDQVQVERRTKVRDRMETLEAPLPEHEEEERKDQEEENQHQEKPEETGEAEKNNRTEERQENTEETDKNKVPARGRKTGRGRNDEQILVEQNSGPKSDDGPARRTRSRSNSSNSISSERSASSVGVQDNRGRGRGRGAKPKSQPPQTPGGRNVTCRRTRRDSRADDAPPQEVFSRSNSSNSLNSDISSSSVSSVRQRERTRRTEVPVGTQRSSISAPRAAAGGRRGRNTEGAANVTEEKVEPLQSRTTRGQRRATASSSEVAAPGEDNQSTQEESLVSEEPHHSKRKVRGQVEKSISDVRAVTSPHHSSVSDADETKGDTRRGRKRELQATVEEGSCSGAKVVKVENQRPTTQEESKDEAVVHTRRRGRTSTAQPKKTAVEEKVKEEEVEKVVQRRGRGRSTAVYNIRKEEEEVEEEEESGTPPPAVDQDGDMEQAVTRTVTRKRPSSVNSTPVAKTRRASSSSSSSFSSSSPAAAGGRVRAASQDFRVLFTGLVDEAGEKVLVRLGGSMAKGIADMNILVTDKVRRTVKFLCAMAKGVPIVTTRWLEMSGRAGSFISTDTFLVKDPEQEKKFSFCLQESLRRSQGQPLLQGYEVHVTKSVKPEPVHMKDIISCSGGTFLPRMPCSHKPQTVVVSCEADWALCGPAVAASLPVVSVEFILTGILQQKVDLQSHALTVAQPRPAAGRGRARRKV